MGTAFKIVVFTLLVCGIIFARGSKNNLRVEEKKVKSEHYWVKDHSKDNGNNDYCPHNFLNGLGFELEGSPI